MEKVEIKELEVMEVGEFRRTEYFSASVIMMKLATAILLIMTMKEENGLMGMPLITNPTLHAAREEKEIMEPMEIMETLEFQVIQGHQEQLVRMESVGDSQ